jgi:hypothetical protein
MMKEQLIAPCGMNCRLCIHYQVGEQALPQKGYKRVTCPGCIPRGEHCTHMGDHCPDLRDGLLRFCFQCPQYPCKRLKALDKRYRNKYHMSMIQNLDHIQSKGMADFLQEQQIQWVCPTCGGVICCHNGLCLSCDLEVLKNNRRYRWGEEPTK